MKSILITSLIVMSLGAVGGYFFAGKVYDEKIVYTQTEEDNQISKSPNRMPASVRPIPSQKNPKIKDLSYIQQVILNENAKNLHRKVIEQFANLDSKEKLADWVVLGLKLDNSPEFSKAMQQTINELNENPQVVLDSINNNYQSIGPKNAFIRSMLVNVVHQLNVGASEKLKFYGTRFSDSINIKDGQLDEDSMNVSNSIAFANQYVEDISQVRPFVNEGLEKASDNKKVQLELAQRFKAYFPDLSAQIDKQIAQ